MSRYRRLWSWVFAEADIIVGSSKAMALSKTAVIQVADEYFVMVLKNETSNEYQFRKAKLEIGLQT